MADGAWQVDRSFFVVDAGFAGDRICGYESAEAEGEQDVFDCVWNLGGVCGGAGWVGVYFFLMSGNGRALAWREFDKARGPGGASPAPTGRLIQLGCELFV